MPPDGFDFQVQVLPYLQISNETEVKVLTSPLKAIYWKPTSSNWWFNRRMKTGAV